MSVRLGDIADFSNGINFDKTAYGQGIKMIAVSDFGNRFFPDIEQLQEVKMEVVRQGNLLEEGDIVFVRSNGNKELVGRCMLIPHLYQLLTFSGFVIRCRILEPKWFYPRFFAYYFKTKAFRRAMGGTAVGANIQNLSQTRLSAHVATIPDITTQTKIANILSSYDDLIENNRKQIKLLEEAAQRIYKEWFIDLHFPGYETTPIVDGIPDGWEEKNVTDLLEIKYGKDHKSLADGRIPVYGSGGVMRKVDRVLYSGESVLIPRKGSLNNIIYADCDFWTIDTMFYSIPRIPNIAKYMYLFLSCLDMYSFNIGAAVPSMTVNILDGIKALLPESNILERFENIVAPLFRKKELLEKQSEIATETRDRLLPKLMTGEIEE